MAFLDESGLSYLWQKIQNAIKAVGASDIKFSDGESIQAKFDSGELGLPYSYGTTDLVDGESALPTGQLYFVYEE